MNLLIMSPRWCCKPIETVSGALPSVALFSGIISAVRRHDFGCVVTVNPLSTN
jgi:hypothetical protein